MGMLFSPVRDAVENFKQLRDEVVFGVVLRDPDSPYNTGSVFDTVRLLSVLLTTQPVLATPI